VSLAAVHASAKIEDTLKKPKDLLAISYAVRFPELVSKSKNATGEVDIDHMDQAVAFTLFLSMVMDKYANGG
jgi:CTD kinase subunit beta